MKWWQQWYDTEGYEKHGGEAANTMTILFGLPVCGQGINWNKQVRRESERYYELLTLQPLFSDLAQMSSRGLSTQQLPPPSYVPVPSGAPVHVPDKGLRWIASSSSKSGLLWPSSPLTLSELVGCIYLIGAHSWKIKSLNLLIYCPITRLLLRSIEQFVHVIAHNWQWWCSSSQWRWL